MLTPFYTVRMMGVLLHSIQQSAALALGRLANYSDDLAEAVVQNEILPQLVSTCTSLQQPLSRFMRLCWNVPSGVLGQRSCTLLTCLQEIAQSCAGISTSPLKSKTTATLPNCGCVLAMKGVRWPQHTCLFLLGIGLNACLSACLFVRKP